MPVQEVELNFYKTYDVERWMWECPQCHEQSSVHVNQNYRPKRLVCSKCCYAVYPQESVGEDFSETVEGVGIQMECPKVTRLSLMVEAVAYR
jgi:transposase-like protein